MRILHILDHSLPLQSGYTFRTLAIVQQQRRLGWETFHITSAKHGLNTVSLPADAGAHCETATVLEETVENLHFFRTPPAAGWLARLPVLDQASVVSTLVKRLQPVLAQVRPDIVHAHSPALNGLAALIAANRAGLPVVYEIRAFWEDAAVDHGVNRAWDLRYRSARALETYVLRRVAAVTTICQGLRDEIVARGVPTDKVTVIPNAVDIAQFASGGAPDPALRERLGLNQAQVLGFVGSFYSYEGLALLIEALPRLLAQAPELRLLLVGSGPQEPALKDLTRQLKLNERVIFTGRVPHTEVQRYYDLIDILVYPRLSMRLTDLVTPLKPLEAMAQGRLLLASDVGGHRELIRDGVTGVLFQAGSSDALIEKILALLAQPERWPALRQQARQLVETERNWAASVARYGPVYARLAPAATP